MNALSDEQLIARLMQGEREALSPLVERYHRLLLGYLYRLTNGNQPLAEDLVQDTFMRILQQDSYQPGRPFKPWLFSIATHLAYDYFRSAAVRRAEPLNDSTHGNLPDGTDGPEVQALNREEGQTIQEALQQIGEAYRPALLLRYYSGLSLQEIAAALDIPLGTVKSRLSTGAQRLRGLLVALREGGER